MKGTFYQERRYLMLNKIKKHKQDVAWWLIFMTISSLYGMIFKIDYTYGMMTACFGTLTSVLVYAIVFRLTDVLITTKEDID